MAVVLNVWPLSNYGFGSKAPESLSRDRSEPARLARLRARFASEGTRRSVAALLVVHVHRHPHLLLLQDLSASSPPSASPPHLPNQPPPPPPPPPPSAFRLPGGRLRPGEDEVSGLARKLRARLSPPREHPGAPLAAWDVPRERAGVLTRPGFEGELYPYCPAHVTVPKEEIFLRVVPLPERLSFAVPEGFRLVAVPLMELHASGRGGGAGGGAAGGGAEGRFGAVAAAAPALLSRYALSLAAVSAPAPKVGLPPPDDGRMWKRSERREGKGEEGGGGGDKALAVVVAGGGASEKEISSSPPPRPSSSSPPKQEGGAEAEEKQEEEAEQEEKQEMEAEQEEKQEEEAEQEEQEMEDEQEEKQEEGKEKEEAS